MNAELIKKMLIYFASECSRHLSGENEFSTDDMLYLSNDFNKFQKQVESTTVINDKIKSAICSISFAQNNSDNYNQRTTYMNIAKTVSPAIGKLLGDNFHSEPKETEDIGLTLSAFRDEIADILGAM